MKKVKLSKAEKKRLKLEKGYQLRRDYLTREIIYGRGNIAKYNKAWSSILKEISCEYLARDVLAYCHGFERAIDYKDVEISLYMDWIDEGRNRFWLSLAEHTQKIKRIIEMFYENHQYMQNDLENHVSEQLAQWLKDNEEIAAKAKENREYLETMRYRMSCVQKDEEDENYLKMYSQMNEKTQHYTMLLEDVTFNSHKKIGQLCDEIRNWSKSYLASARRKEKENAESIDHFEMLERDVSANMKRRGKLVKLIQSLQEKYEELFSTLGKELTDLTKERDDLHECFSILKEKLFRDKKNDTFKQLVLTSASNDMFEEMERIEKRGTIILKYLATCRRYMTKEDKVKPNIHEKKRKYFDPKLSIFWKKLAAIEGSRYTLNEERIYLKMENEKLSKKIHSFCQCLQCPANPPIPNRAGKIPYTEGREMIKKNKTQNEAKDIDEDFV